MLLSPYITRGYVTELQIQRSAEAALAVMTDPSRALLRTQMASSPAMGAPGSGNYDPDGVWHDHFRLDHSLLDGDDIMI